VHDVEGKDLGYSVLPIKEFEAKPGVQENDYVSVHHEGSFQAMGQLVKAMQDRGNLSQLDMFKIDVDNLETHGKCAITAYYRPSDKDISDSNDKFQEKMLITHMVPG